MKKSVALSGVNAGSTRICSVGETEDDLFYRGYSIKDLAEGCSFEEVYFLLTEGKLPTKPELSSLSDDLLSLRYIPTNLIRILEELPKTAHPMNVMQTITSFIGCFENYSEISNEPHNLKKQSRRLISILTPALLYWYYFSHKKKRISLDSSQRNISKYFLELMHQDSFDQNWASAMDISLILYAEHEFNASTFTSRVIAGTNSDFFSCIAGAIGALRGTKHGGANEEALKTQQNYQNKELAVLDINKKLANKEIVNGFGHPVYTKSDPRNNIIKCYAKKLSQHDNYINNIIDNYPLCSQCR